MFRAVLEESTRKLASSDAHCTNARAPGAPLANAPIADLTRRAARRAMRAIASRC